MILVLFSRNHCCMFFQIKVCWNFILNGFCFQLTVTITFVWTRHVSSSSPFSTHLLSRTLIMLSWALINHHHYHLHICLVLVQFGVVSTMVVFACLPMFGFTCGYHACFGSSSSSLCVIQPAPWHWHHVFFNTSHLTMEAGLSPSEKMNIYTCNIFIGSVL